MTPLISVLLPVYNAAATLAECLQSVLQQTYPHFEVIVVDDGSDDASATLLDRLASQYSHIRLYRQTHNGLVAALNNGLQHCQGDFIARMDADDRMSVNRLERQLQFALAHPTVDLLGCQYQLFRDDAPISSAQQRYQQWSNALLDDHQIKQDIWLEAPIAHPTFFARKSFFESLQGYRDLPWTEDYDLLLRACQSGARFGKIPEVLLQKRDSATRLYRTDPRCKRPAMLAAKAHYFIKGNWLNGGKKLYLAGSGSSARTVAKALQAEGIAVSGFIDDVCGPPNRTVMGLPCWYRNSKTFNTLLIDSLSHFFILCIGDPNGRAEQQAQFQTAGLRQDEHYLRFL